MNRESIMKEKSNILSREHPLGFLILREKTQTFGSDSHIFFHGQQLLPYSTGEEYGKELKAKRIRGLKKSEEKGRVILKNIGLAAETLLVNPRYEECYFKLDSSYFSVTYTGQKIPKIDRFNFFVTNGCLFGTYIQGIQADGKKTPLIDHQLKISSPIQDIIVEEKFHPYENNNFDTLIKHISLMKKIGTDDLSIIYHLPVIDYILSSILRFIRGEMNLSALNKFIVQVKIRGNRHKQKLQEIAKSQQVSISVVSPFDNLWDAKQQINIDSLLSLLMIESDWKDGQIDDASRATEKQFVERLLFLLTKNEYNPEFKKIWNELFSRDIAFQAIHSLKDLLSMGNASIIAYATRIPDSGTQNKTCAWLPADEYPVVAHYKRTMTKLFGEVFCFSFIPSILNYVGMEKDGSGQQTLFRYLPDHQISSNTSAIPQSSRKSLWLSSDNFYINCSDNKLYLSLYCLSRSQLFFLGHILLRKLHVLYQLVENCVTSQLRFDKKYFLIHTKDNEVNKFLNDYALFGNNNKIKINFGNHQEKHQDSCCPIL